MAYKYVYADVCTIVNEQEATNRQRSVVPLSVKATLFVYGLDLLVEHLSGKAINRDVQDRRKISPSSAESDERFDFAKKCRSGKRATFGFVQLNPFIDRFTQLCINCQYIAPMYSAKHKAGAATNIALIFFTPGNNFHIAIRCLAHD